MASRHTPLVEALVRNVLEGPGQLDAEMRRALTRMIAAALRDTGARRGVVARR